MSIRRQSVYFSAPGKVELRAERMPSPAAGQMLVQSQLSAISPGSELLVYRGQFPGDIPVDAGIAALSGKFAYPIKYGYSTVGRVIALGKAVDPSWEHRQVFAFHPHESHFLASAEELLVVPAELPLEQAVFLPNMETALNFVMDGKPLIGERVAVFGQGIVGLLTVAILARFPLESLISFDRYELRRRASISAGAHASLDPYEIDQAAATLTEGADLTFELSGAPAALDTAIQVTGYAGRVVIGSWYGEKKVTADLGGRFHRSRIQLVSSQVSSLAPELSGRWTKTRRFAVAWEMLKQVSPSQFITHRLPLEEAPRAYRLLDQEPGNAIQIVLTYEE